MNLLGSVGCVWDKKIEKYNQNIDSENLQKACHFKVQILDRRTEIKSITGEYVVRIGRDKVGLVLTSVAGFII